jgi:membrane associated rhomboid family serine protease
MNYTTTSSWGPEKTPPLIKQLIILISIVAILSAGVQSLLEQFNVFPGPQNFLSLSWWGLGKGYLWQPLSFLFIQEAQGGLSFSFFFTLFFNMYLLWVVGSTVYEVIGKTSFLRLYLIGGVAAGLLALLTMKITGQYEMLTGLSAALFILFTLWSMAFPETEILLFFLIPVKVKWIALSFIGIVLLSALTHLAFSSFFLYLFAILIGYGYSVIVQGWYSPFPQTLKFDLWLSRTASRVRQKIPFFKPKPEDIKTPNAKIIDITSASYKNDDEFVDAMLTKISQKGEDSLSWSEKKRLQEISQKKMKDQ